MFVLLLLCSASVIGQDEKLQPGDVERARSMLSDVNDAIKNHYYDPKYQGLDLQARYKEALDKVNAAKNFNQMLGIIAWFMDGLNDSHAFFVPPPHAFRIDYGWRAQMIGDRCFITQVRPDSDAAKQQLKEGDQVLAINGLAPTRDSLYKIEYVFGVLRPQPGLRLQIVTPEGVQKSLDLKAMIKPTRRQITITNFWDEVREHETDSKLYTRRSAEVNDILIWKLANFMMPEKGADNMVDDARNSKAIILDLRGNPGGSAEAVERLVAEFFDHDVKVADFVGRKKMDLRPSVKGRNRYAGKLIVLIDSQSASASEIFARVMQLEHRATIIGDRSEGAVMVAQGFPMQAGLDHTIFYGASITVAQMLMKDGTSLEKVGVQPDELLLPTASDLAGHRDPVLAHAVELAGGKLSPEEAGKLFPYEWPAF